MNRRGFLSGFGALIAAPAIVHAGNLMPIKAVTWADPVAWAGGLDYAELAGVTRKALVPRLFVQIYAESPVIRALQQLRSEAA